MHLEVEESINTFYIYIYIMFLSPISKLQASETIRNILFG